ncbi:hypothetical protein JCM10213v2_000420 [Rhodosporidiobolus nylandii]
MYVALFPSAAVEASFAPLTSLDSMRKQGADSFQQPLSPLRQSQAIFPSHTDADSSVAPLWTHPSPFNPTPFPAAPSTSLFCANASDFSLPSTDFSRRIQRGRHASTESNLFGASTSSLSSSPPASFEDSSFSSSSTSTSHSDNSPPHSFQSASSSFATFTFSCARPPLRALRRASSCNSPMLCEGTGDIPTLQEMDEDGEERLDREAERLHHVAFEQLRSSTKADEEGFVERMRRWEAENGSQAREAREGSVELLPAPVSEDEASEGEGGYESEEDEEVEVTLDLGSQAAGSPPPVSSAELDELSHRLRSGACELEDFSLVRAVQARTGGARRLQMQA